jgi:integrase/recombinase XerD
MSSSKPTPSFASLLQTFFLDYLSQHRAVSPRTIGAYRDTFRLLLQFAERHIGKSPTTFALADLNAEFILAFLDHLQRDRKNVVRSRNARLAALRCFLKYAARHDLSVLSIIERALAVPMKRFDRPMLGFLSRREVQAILDAPSCCTWVGQRDRALFAMLYNTGARVSEVTNMRIKDLVLDAAPCIHIMGKGRKHRTVPLWRSTVTLMRAWQRQLGDIAPDAHLFPNRVGTAMTRSNVRQRLEWAVRSVTKSFPQLRNRRVSPHCIRHTTAMHLLQSGNDIQVIALWLGHESPSTTHMYVEADLAMKQRALDRLQPPDLRAIRYRPPDPLMEFLQNL